MEMLHASRNHELPLKIFIYLSKTLQNAASWKVAIETTLHLRRMFHGSNTLVSKLVKTELILTAWSRKLGVIF